MEKLLRRSILNRNQLVTKKRQESVKDLRKAWRQYKRAKIMQNHELDRLIKDERKARREDWILGPLAPKRDVGLGSRTYGAVSNMLAQRPDLPDREKRWPKGSGYDATGNEDRRIPGFEDGEWKGKGLRGNLASGDRVVVIKGRPGVKGKIGEIVRIDKKPDTVFIKDVNKVDMRIPPQAESSVPGRKIIEQELAVPISDIRLITQRPDPESGVLTDVIVRNVYGGAPYIQRSDGSNLPRHTRYIIQADDQYTSEDIIPWPKDDPDRFYPQNCDTTRGLVQLETYMPQLRGPNLDDPQEVPVMLSAVDELRSKHSRQRRDWDDAELMRKKLLEDARRDWFKQRSKILSQPFWTKEFIAREKQAALAAAAQRTTVQ